MTNFRTHFLTGAVAIALSSSAFVVNAQTSAGEHCTPDRSSTGAHHWHGGAKSPEQMKEKIAKRQAELHDKLNLSASQESAWNLFTSAMTPSGMRQHPDRAAWEKLSAPERMEKQLAMIKEKEARMTNRLAATKTFYAVLTPEQQKIFDENFMNRRHHGKS